MSIDATFLDMETSGLNFRTDKVIEVCAVRVRNGVPTAVFNTMVYHEGLELNPTVTKVTGHTTEDIQDGMSEEAVTRILAEFIGDMDEILIAYNAMFDLSFLETLFIKYEVNNLISYMGQLGNPFVDPCTIARDRKQYPHKLKAVCKHYGIALEDAHSAYADTFALVDLTLAMDKEKSIEDYLNKAGYLRKYEEPEWYPPHATLYPQGALKTTHNVTKRKPQTLNQKIRSTPAIDNSKKRKKIPQ